MKERGMIFNGEMVRAILDGRKTQTRRIIKQRHLFKPVRGFGFEPDSLNYPVHMPVGTEGEQAITWAKENCPYGNPGDRIWVRETWARYNIEQDNHDIAYRATTPEDWPKEGRWRPSIHMPRWASRITLEITDVRVERLQSISDRDALAEGLYQLPASGRYCLQPGMQYFGEASHSAQEVYSWLWESIYGEGSWQANPWVWAIKFRQIEREKRNG
jgi:hypothetical protein